MVLLCTAKNHDIKKVDILKILEERRNTLTTSIFKLESPSAEPEVIDNGNIVIEKLPETININIMCNPK